MQWEADKLTAATIMLVNDEVGLRELYPKIIGKNVGNLNATLYTVRHFLFVSTPIRLFPLAPASHPEPQSAKTQARDKLGHTDLVMETLTRVLSGGGFEPLVTVRPSNYCAVDVPREMQRHRRHPEYTPKSAFAFKGAWHFPAHTWCKARGIGEPPGQRGQVRQPGHGWPDP